MFGTVFKIYQPPTESEANANTQIQDSRQKRSRGRPKGSKNKPKEDASLNANTNSNSNDDSVGLGDSGRLLTSVKKQGRPSGMGHERTNIEKEPERSSVNRMLSSSTIRQETSCISEVESSTLKQQTITSERDSRAVSPPFSLVSDLSQLRSVNSSGTRAIKQPTSLANISNPNSISTRTVVDRARFVQVQSDGMSTSPPTTSPSSPNPIDFITDVENEFDPRAFVAEGIGEEDNDEDEDRQPSLHGSKRRKPFPEWFQVLLEKIHDELKHDLEDTLPGKSRHYLSGSFWLSRKAVWFLLSTANVKPTDLFVPEFFLWDPASLMGTSIACPDCSCSLTRDGVVRRPRRVVDVDSTFWLIGYTYVCRKRGQGAGGCGLKFRSWDQRILQRLPLSLAAEFPAHLTWRSGLSTRAFGIVRSCFQHGMGAEEVADLFRMQHLRRFDEVRLQYLRAKVLRMGLPGQTYEPFLPFEDCSSSGFHGFTPSGQWLRDIYDTFIESYRDVLNQHTAMLSARLAKHVFKVDGVPIFTALLSVTNEKGEIKVCVFVATKSHSQYENALRRLADDLSIYGHDLPEVFYTDNMVDKAMLEGIFASLRDNVTPVEKHAHLPLLTVPSYVNSPIVLDSTTAIDNAMWGILDAIPSNSYLVVGFDSEWNVEVAPYGQLSGRGPPAVIQIAHDNQVYILQVGEMLSRRKLPAELVNFLREPRVVKAGRQVNNDLRHLAVAAGYDPGSFRGALDLAGFAKDRFLIPKANLSLADLTASILHLCLPKNQAERISSNWTDRELNSNQLEYAARDAYVSLLLYHEINKTPLPTPLSSDTPCGTPVVLLTDDNKSLAAHGIISPAASLTRFDGINVTATRTVITVQCVHIPGAIIGQNKKRALKDCGTPPFDVLAHCSHVRVVTSCVPVTPITILSPSPSSPPHPVVHIPDDISAMSKVLETDTAETDMVSAGEVETENSTDQVEENLESFERDEASVGLGVETLGSADAYSFSTIIRSRVIKDVFHVFHMLYISRTHGLRVAFSWALRDAFLIPHPTDKARIEAYLKTQGVTWDSMLRFHSTWLWRHCRRTIPPPEVLYPLVHQVFMTWGPLKDAKTHLPLFNAAAWKVSKNILELVKNGHVSDPPGVELYYCIGFDQKAGSLPIYRCIRGTNMVEGGVHTHLLAKLPSGGASVRHMVSCLLDFVLRHNLRVGHFNSTGKKYRGHDSIWMLNHIQELEITLNEYYGILPNELAWVNGNLYKQTHQTVGILSIPHSICDAVKIQPYNAEVDTKQKQGYLAQMQGTRLPVLPVHTLSEKSLFSKLMRTSPTFQSCKTAVTVAATEIWNREAEKNSDVYYKLEEQLTSYLNGSYKDSANIRQSCSQARDATAALECALQDTHRSDHILNAQSGNAVPHRVTLGFHSDAHVMQSPRIDISATPGPSTYVQELAATNKISPQRNLGKLGLVLVVAEKDAKGVSTGFRASSVVEIVERGK